MDELSVIFITHLELMRCLILLWYAGIPAALIGNVGAGKTTAVQMLVRKLSEQINNFKYWPVMLGLVSAEDIGGFPSVADGILKFIMPGYLPFDCEDSGIIFFDEYDRAGSDVQNASTQILLGGHIHGHQISPNSYSIIAMNGLADIYTTPLSKAVRNRVCTLFLSSESGGNIKAWNEYAEQNDIHPVIRGFANFRTDLLEKNEQFEELAIPSPRSRDMAGQILKAAEQVEFETEDILLPCIAGVIGKAAAIELMSFRKNLFNMPDLKCILDGTGDIDGWINEPSMMFAIGSGILGIVENRDDGVNAVKVATKMPDEVGTWMMDTIVKRIPEVASSPDYQSYFKTRKEWFV